MAIARKKPPIFNIPKMQAEAKADVAFYYDIIGQISEMIERHSNVSHNFIVEQILRKNELSDEWFMEMQGYHKEMIIDQIKPKRKD